MAETFWVALSIGIAETFWLAEKFWVVESFFIFYAPSVVLGG